MNETQSRATEPSSRRRLLLVFLLSLTVLSLVLLAPKTGGARTIVVDQDGGGDYLSFEDGVKNATDGDTILVREGNYTLLGKNNYSLITVSKSLTIIGEGPETTRLLFPDQGNGKTFSINRNDIRLSGVNISAIPGSGKMTVGILCSWGNISIDNCSFFGLRGGVSLENGQGVHNFTMRDNQFWDTRLSQPWIQPEEDRNVTLENNSFGGLPFYFLWGKSDLSFQGDAGGFALENCHNISISDCQMNRHGNGVYITNSTAIQLKNSTLVGGKETLTINKCQDIEVLGCVIRELEPMYGRGILITESFSGIVVKDCFLDDTCLEAHFSSSLRIQDNIITGVDGQDPQVERDLYYGISLRGCTESIITGNRLESDGIRLDPFWDYNSDHKSVEEVFAHHIDDNKVGGRPIRYYRNQTGVTVPENTGQIIALNCPGILVQGLILSNTSSGVFLVNCTGAVVRNCSTQDNDIGVSVYYTDGCLIENCTTQDATGFSFTGLENGTVRNNQLSDNSFSGLMIRYSQENLITGNNCSENIYGIYLTSAGHNSITNNTITHNRAGVMINYGSDYFPSDSNVIHYNDLSSNRYGIESWSSKGIDVDARFNWWGNSSGPRNSETNPNGTGSGVADQVEFSPWQTDSDRTNWTWDMPEEPVGGDGEENDQPITMVLFTLILLLIIVLFLAVFLIPQSRKETETLPVPEAPSTTVPQPPLPSSQTNRCPLCQGEFEITTEKRPIHFNCHFCGKEIVLE